jgi:hypothetical protein
MPREARAMASEIMATPPRLLIASAVNLTNSGSSRKKKQPKSIRTEKWQLVAWEWYDEIPEYRSACTWMGSMISRAVLYPTKDGVITTDAAAVEAMNLLYGGQQGQSEMLRQLGIQFTVAGEAYIVGEDGGENLRDKWYVVAATEIQRNGEQWKMGKKELDSPLVIRMWRPHPRTYFDADSPSRPVLPILAELDGLTKHVAAQIDSRLIGGGLLLFPEEMTVGSSPSTRINENDEKETVQLTGADQILDTLMRTFTTAISNRESAAALSPIIASGPGEHLDKVRLIDFYKELDAAAKDLREEAIRRLALGMDLPPELLTGTGDVNHWGAWQIDETSVKAYAEPMLAIVNSSLAEGYLRPYLIANGMDKDEAQAYGIGADTSELRLRPNRSKEALELFDRGELSAAATLRENGFHEDDAMGDDEKKQQLIRKIASGTTTPEAVVAAAKLLGVDLEPLMLQITEGQPVTTENPPERRSLDEHPSNDPPELDESMVAGADFVVFRALERAGNRLKTKKFASVTAASAAGVPASDLYLHASGMTSADIADLLQDAWAPRDRFCPLIPEQTLVVYVGSLIASGRQHSRELLVKYLGSVIR